MRIHIDNTIQTGAGLTSRQATIVSLLSDGHSVKQVAQLLGISPRTVDVHLANARRTTETPNLAALVAKSIRQRWIS